jgi:RNA polymerase sigma-70 factor (ECF subfamily)
MPLLRTDPELLARFRRGEPAALERVYWEYVDRVEHVVRRGFQLMRGGGTVQGLGRDDIADMVQETFMRAFSEGARLAYDGLRDYGPFLLTITRNLIASRGRKYGRELPTKDLEALEAVAVVEEKPLADEATLGAVRDYLARLDDPLRGVHEQRFVGGASQEEAGRALGLSRQQIRTLERRLLDGLAAHLEQVGLAENKTATSLPAQAYRAKGALK